MWEEYLCIPEATLFAIDNCKVCNPGPAFVDRCGGCKKMKLQAFKISHAQSNGSIEHSEQRLKRLLGIDNTASDKVDLQDGKNL